MRSLKLVSILDKSTIGKLDKLEDNKRRERNTFAGLRCCSNLCYDKTREKSIGELFMFVKISEKLSRELSRELIDT
jgi:hypothetical protein